MHQARSRGTGGRWLGSAPACFGHSCRPPPIAAAALPLPPPLRPHANARPRTRQLQCRASACPPAACRAAHPPLAPTQRRLVASAVPSRANEPGAPRLAFAFASLLAALRPVTRGEPRQASHLVRHTPGHTRRGPSAWHGGVYANTAYTVNATSAFASRSDLLHRVPCALACVASVAYEAVAWGPPLPWSNPLPLRGECARVGDG